MPGDDQFAAIEATGRAISQDALSLGRKEGEVLEDGRRAVQKEIHAIVIWALRFGAFLLAAMVAVRLWHMACPSSMRWLAEGDLQGMDKMLFSSAFGGVILSYLKQIMRPIAKT
ncbi:hypothetical protein PCP09_11780 [Pseudomonas aeruginosa]|uniref:hypothetical protein n=1 Tax=Pseudomonas aeruginosa TaxID=287 RepID=UPI000EAF2538|nr:hypothetical protein [Pseudomonas aeruginosa]MCO1673187.1 hypothetical protein [Pseudomonas aeruginosa]MCO1771384.1 hypothetical protein [Pseudomonas aeruginosa]HBN9709426.1 hypothetical protein [Pseudomonas aeruginosa]HCL3337445.1 hypothetical protein [Pseudomonas aeruginosa]